MEKIPPISLHNRILDTEVVGPNSAFEGGTPTRADQSGGLTQKIDQETPAGQNLPQSAEVAELSGANTTASEAPKTARRNWLSPASEYTGEKVQQTQPALVIQDSAAISMETDSHEGSASYTPLPWETEDERTKKERPSSERDTVSLTRNNSTPFFWDGQLPGRQHHLPDHHVSMEEWKRVNVSIVPSFLPFNIPVH